MIEIRGQKNTVQHALLSCSEYFQKCLIISFILALLALTPLLYMLVIYSHFIPSHDQFALLAACGLIIIIYAVMEYIDSIRKKLLLHASLEFDEKISSAIITTMCGLNSSDENYRYAPFSDLAKIKSFFTSPPGIGIFELVPAVLVFWVIYLMSPILAFVVFIAILIQIGFTFIVEKKVVPTLETANHFAIESRNFIYNISHVSGVIFSMGMVQNLFKKWIALEEIFINQEAQASKVSGINTALGRFVQVTQSSLLMGIACWLALHGELLGGEGMIIIVASLGGRVISPAVNISANWNQVIELRSSYQRLKRFLLSHEEIENLMTLPPMLGALSVHNLYVKNFKSDVFLLRNINFDLKPGESLLITGPVGSGKSTLLNAITNLLPLFSGDIRFDGFESKAWNKSQLGLSIGYLPQNIQLLDGTLAENISRFAEPDESLLNVACDLAGIWPLIESLPSGLQTKIGTGENILSGGQRQLVGLARALYGNPKILILDEPNSGLDLVANNNFIKTIEEIKKNGCTILVVSHRTDFLFLIDKILVLSFGNTMSYGPKIEVLEKHRRTSNTALNV